MSNSARSRASTMSPVPSATAADLSGLVNLSVNDKLFQGGGTISKSIAVASGMAGSIRDLVYMVPVAYRPVTNRVLNEYATKAKRTAESIESLAKLESFKARGKTPPWLQAVSSTPVYDLTKESPTQGAALRLEFAQLCKNSVTAYLDACILARTSEVKRLGEATSWSTYKTVCDDAVNSALSQIKTVHGLKADAVLGITTIDKAIKADYDFVKETLPHLVKRVLEINLAKADERTGVWAKKAVLFDEAKLGCRLILHLCPRKM
jgi:hypothetical protein